MIETINQQGVASDELVRKIQLLINLGQRSEGNEQEAAAAMAKAQELLAKYNLDMATVEDKAAVAGNKAKSAADAKREKVEGKRNATYEWTRDLVRARSPRPTTASIGRPTCGWSGQMGRRGGSSGTGCSGASRTRPRCSS